MELENQNLNDLKFLERRLACERNAHRRVKARLWVKQLELDEAQQQLRASTAELEQRVATRTAELSARNAQLECELAQYRRAEKARRAGAVNYAVLFESAFEETLS